MKILHLIYTNGIAGAEKYLMHLLPSVNNFGYECHLILVCAPEAAGILEPYHNKMQQLGVTISIIPSNKRQFLQTAFKVGRYMRKHKICFLHSHLLNTDIIASLVKMLFFKDVVIISTKHGYSEKILRLLGKANDFKTIKKIAKKDIYYYVTRFVIRQSKFNYAVSAAMSDLYYKLGLSPLLMDYIHHGVSVPEINNSGNPFRIAKQQLIIVGRLEEFKGHRYLIEAFPEVVKKFPDCKLVILGNGSELNSLNELSKQLKIQDNVLFAGFQHDPYSFVANSDIVILPSLFEPFGLVYIEAFALGKPVIAFDTPAGNEIIHNYETGILVPAKNTSELSKKIIELLEDPLKASKLGKAARAVYNEQFSTERMVRDTCAFYEKVASSKKC